MVLHSRYLKTRKLSRFVLFIFISCFIIYGTYIFAFQNYLPEDYNVRSFEETAEDMLTTEGSNYKTQAVKRDNENDPMQPPQREDKSEMMDIGSEKLKKLLMKEDWTLRGKFQNVTRRTATTEESSTFESSGTPSIELDMPTPPPFYPFVPIKTLSPHKVQTENYPKLNYSETEDPYGAYNILFYNRVPKCGSTAMNNLLLKLGKVNGFDHYSSRDFWSRRISIPQQVNFLRRINKNPKPFSVDRHVYFINASHFLFNDVIYINLIRDPVERFNSHFYYLRAPKRWKNKNNMTSTIPPKSWFEKDFSDCVLLDDPECSFISGSYKDMTIAYFCGHELECMKLNSRWALNRAKENVERYFPVVGVLEDIELMTMLAEQILPKFFRGAHYIYTNEVSNLHKNDNPYKHMLSPKIKKILRNKLYVEYEFYHFIKQRLARQKRNLL